VTERLTRYSADKILREATKRVGLEGVSTHSFRRTALNQMSNAGIPLRPKVLNVKILMILPKLCIGIGDTKFEQLMTLFSIDNGLYPGKTQRL
jgi:hypothetical protein